MPSPDLQLMQSFLADDHAAVDKLLTENPKFKALLNQGVLDYQIPPLAACKSREMVDVLIGQGAKLASVETWWKPGFFVHQVDAAIAQYLIELGAEISIHAAAGIGLFDVVQDMLREFPSMALLPGGDGAQPLHFCTRVEIAQLLILHGASVDVRDEDHNSTPAQWRIGDAPDVVRYLLNCGATADIFMTAGLGDVDLANELIAADAQCTTYRIGHNNGPFPGIGFQGRGGTIYQWTLGFNLSPHEVALKQNHTNVYELLLENTPPRAKFLLACTSANRQLAESIAAGQPDIVDTLNDEDLSLLAKSCWETNKDIDAVRLMLDMGFPAATPECNHGHTPLHNAAWCGDPELVQLLIDRGHPTDVRDPDYDSTPIGWAIHSCLEAKRHPDGRFAEVVQLLLEHGTPFDKDQFPVGHEQIDAVISRHLQAKPKQ